MDEIKVETPEEETPGEEKEESEENAPVGSEDEVAQALSIGSN